MEVRRSMNIETVEALVEDTVTAVLAGGLVKRIAAEVWEKLKGTTDLDEKVLASLKELRQHCQAGIDLIDRITSVVL